MLLLLPLPPLLVLLLLFLYFTLRSDDMTRCVRCCSVRVKIQCKFSVCRFLSSFLFLCVACRCFFPLHLLLLLSAAAAFFVSSASLCSLHSQLSEMALSLRLTLSSYILLLKLLLLLRCYKSLCHDVLCVLLLNRILRPFVRFALLFDIVFLHFSPTSSSSSSIFHIHLILLFITCIFISFTSILGRVTFSSFVLCYCRRLLLLLLLLLLLPPPLFI